jgi:hypothetical protein
VALITQSSNIALNLTMQKRGLPLAYVMTVGNQAQTSMAEVAEALLDDVRVTALGLHIEGIGDVAAFEAMADRARNWASGSSRSRRARRNRRAPRPCPIPARWRAAMRARGRCCGGWASRGSRR